MTFNSYLEQIRRTPLLSAEQERELFAAYRAGDIRAREKLVASHLKLVVSAASRYAGLHELEDLVSVGCAGLLIAIERFEPDNATNARLNTYARFWIKAEMQAYVMNNHSSVRIGTTKSQKVIFFSAGRVARTLGIPDTARMTPEEAQRLADALQVDRDVLVETLQRMKPSPSLNAPVSDETDTAGCWIDYVADDTPSVEETLGDIQEQTQRTRIMNESMATLTDRERAIIEMRLLRDPRCTLQEIADHFSISKERARQVAAMAMWKLAGRPGKSPTEHKFRVGLMREQLEVRGQV